jgi:flagellar basal-body rod modification protein FlgD
MGLLCERVATSAPTPNLTLAAPRLWGRPNPFNPSTQFCFDLYGTAEVRLEIIDARGRVVRRLFSGELQAGSQALPWDGRDDHGTPVASGVYVGRLERGDGAVSVTKVALLK